MNKISNSNIKTISAIRNLSLLALLISIPFFAMAQSPAITSFAPTSGPIGTEVIITGSNFDPTPANNIVFLGATQAVVSSSTATSLTITVPSGASYLPITVLANGLLAYSSSPFHVTFDGYGINTATFYPNSDFSTESGPLSIATGDFDGDGKVDMAVANVSFNYVTVYLNTSPDFDNIRFTRVSRFNNITNARSITAGDLDNDGKLDLAVAGVNKINIFMNTSTAPGSLSYDNTLEFSAGLYPQSVTIADFDNDGKADLAVAQDQCCSNDQGLSVFHNTTVGIGMVSFGARIDFLTGILPKSVAAGDLDGDGKIDLVTANRTDNTISVLRNTSSGQGMISFGATQTISTGGSSISSVGSSVSVAIGDFDNDGLADVVVANQIDDNAVVFRNTSITPGNITFAEKENFTTGAYPISVAISDLDGDGLVDIATSNYNGNSISVLKNTSSGSGVISYAEQVEYATGTNPFDVAIGDLNGDGKPDLASANSKASSISVIRNKSELNIETDISAFSINEQTSSAIIDADNHTIALEVYYGTNVSSLIASFSLSYGASAEVGLIDQETDITINDFTNPLTYTINAEDGINVQDWLVTVSVAPPSIETDIISFSFPEQAGNPSIDLVNHTIGISVINGTSLNSLVASFMLSTGASAKISSTEQISSSTINDFTGPVTYTITAQDGTSTQDWIVTAIEAPPLVSIDSFSPMNGPVGTTVTITGTNFDPTPANNIVFFGATQASVFASSTTSLSVSVPNGATYMPLTVLVNGLIAYASSPFVVTFNGKNLGENSFTTKTDFGTATGPRLVVIGDLDGDGLADLAVANHLSNTVSILRNTSSNGVISYAAKIDLSTESETISVAMADLNGDGKKDLAVASGTTEFLNVFMNISETGLIDFDAKTTFNIGYGAHSIAAGDLDNDGKVDLAVAKYNDNMVSVLRNTGTDISPIDFAEKVDFATGEYPIFVSIGDLDSDGLQDLVATSHRSNSLSIFKNTSSTLNSISFDAKIDLATGANPWGNAIGDIDGDGKADLAVSNNQNNSVSIFLNTSDGIISFATKTDFNTGSSPRKISLGDLDGDGMIDLATSNFDGSSVSVLRNLSQTPGSIIFASKSDLAAGAQTGSVAIGDLDGDGKADLVATNRISNTVSTFLNITLPPSTANDFLTFNLSAEKELAMIDPINHTISLELYYGTDLTNQIPEFTLSDAAEARIDGVLQESFLTSVDFTNSVTYSVTAEDGITTQEWTVNVANALPNTETAIIDFSFNEQTGPAIIDPMAGTVEIEVMLGSDLTSLWAIFMLSEGASAQIGTEPQITGMMPNDFSMPVTYTVIAEDGINSRDWLVTVSTEPRNDIEILTFALPEQTQSAIIDEMQFKIDIEVAEETDITALVPEIIVSPGATISPNSGVVQDFTNPITYTVTAENGTSNRDWIVTVTVAEILGIDNQLAIATIYPNPVTDRLILAQNSIMQQPVTLIITDVTGNEVETMFLDGSNSNIEIKVTDYKPGVYLLHMVQKNNRQTLRFVKE